MGIDLRFEWHARKAESNLRKHGVSFYEATTVFADAHAIIRDDLDHSEEEDRVLIIGCSRSDRILVVAYTYRTADTIRLISARRVTTGERRLYEEART
jgi:uncharacterized DUF497 family protein